VTLSLSETRLIASRYVTALFPMAEEKKELDKVLSDLESLSTAINEHGELARVISSPVTTRAAKAAIVAALAKKIKASSLVENTLARMAHNNRLDCLAVLADIFRERLMKARGEIAIEIISATELSKSHVDEIVASVSKTSGAKIHARVSVNQDILGGIMIRRGSALLDYSLRGKLQRLGDSLKARVVTQ
jgi:F-type H+-transporting ATPase subunit delta